MINSLSIKNYALIKQLQMKPVNGFSTITGETGAGKSIMLGALGLLLGNRADTKVLLNSDEKCVVECEFNIKDYQLAAFFEKHDLDYETNTIIRREISPSGKSRAFINDTPVTLDVLKELTPSLVDIHSQHETLLLRKQQFQRAILDSFAGNNQLLINYQEAYKKYSATKKKHNKLSENAAQLREEYDYNAFLYEELKAAELQGNELEELEDNLKTLENSEDIKSAIAQATGILSTEQGALDMLHEVVHTLSGTAKFSKTLASLHERLESALLEIKDASTELEQELEKIDLDPQTLFSTKERVDLLHKLLQKHHVKTEEELLSIQTKLGEKVADTANFDEQLQDLKTELKNNYEEVLQSGKKLSLARKDNCKALEEKLASLLQNLGMPNAALSINIENQEPDSSGIDQIAFLFTANKGIAPSPIEQVASGGEFSRLMFSLKYILAESSAMPTIIFDEIDTGISGEVAIKMGSMMKEMAKTHQVITITHLPQVAAKGEEHYFVYKDDTTPTTTSQIKKLTQEERIAEIAEIIGGKTPSESAYQSARDLLTNN